MLKTEDDCGSDGGSSGNGWARVCDTCRSAPCTVFCRADSAYLCNGCDVRIHGANQVASRHERVWVCEACERAPAAFICKADAASLCVTCDADIHSANPLARRHHRVPVMPISGCVYGPNSATGMTAADAQDGFFGEEDETIDENDEHEAASWLLLNPVKGSTTHNDYGNGNDDDNRNQSNGFLFGGEVDEYLNFMEFNSCGENHEFGDQYNNGLSAAAVAPKNYGGENDSVVPVRFETKDHFHFHHHHNHHQQQKNNYQLNSGYSFDGFISQNASVSSMEVGVVPESTMSDISISNTRPPKGTIDLFSRAPVQMPATQWTPMDREARVLRYREKKKTRKFEKTIRYASRKAYAETRPRIKGRFAKRNDGEIIEMDQKFSNPLMAETGYGIVPSF